MALFQEGNTKGRGRPKGSLNAKKVLPKALTSQALEQLSEKVAEGDTQAILFVLNRVYPALKQVTPDNSLDAQLIQVRINEAAEFEKRLEALEAVANEKRPS